MSVLSRLYSNVTIASDQKKTPGSIRSYYETKCNVVNLDKMAGKYFQKFGSRRCSVHSFLQYYMH